MRDYELVFILKPELEDEQVTAFVERLSQQITGAGGSVTKVDHWGRKKLAYPIEHKRDGRYVLMHLKLTPARAQELDANLRITEDVLRHLLVRLDEK